MHTNLQRDELIKPLGHVTGVVEKRQTLPILSFVLLRQSAEGVTLTGTDLEVEIVSKVEAKGGDEGEITLPARKLLDICRALPEGAAIDVRKEGDKAVIKSGKSRFSLLTLPASDFPYIQATQWDQNFFVEQNLLKNLLLQTGFCMAQQDTRYFLNGILLDLNGKALHVVGTDGHRMAVSESTLSGAEIGSATRQAIIPRKGVHEMTRLLADTSDPAEVRLAQSHIQVHTGQFTFTSKLIDGKYPDYRKVVPVSQNKQIRVDRETLREALGRTAILSNEKYRGVRFNVTDRGIRISAQNPEQEEAVEEISADYSGDPIEIGFNVSYMIEAISAIQNKEIVIGLTDANSSCTIHAPDRKNPLYVIMPMRL